LRPSSRAEGLEHNPHALVIHQAIWNVLSAMDLRRRCRSLRRADTAVDLLPDPHVACALPIEHRVVWRCPHCHEWNTFVEERIAPATDNEAEILASLRIILAPLSSAWR
jgi:transposase InsO family protein